jgi:thiamine biosynthesis protein ThiS
MSVSTKVTVNGEARELASERPTVAELVTALGLANQRVAVEVNRRLVTRATWGEAILGEGDVVEIVQFVGGGA